VLPLGKGKLERGIWTETAKYLNCSYRIQDFSFKKIKISLRHVFTNYSFIKQFESDLKLYTRKIPYLYLYLIRLQFHNLDQFLIYHPCKVIVLFEQSSPHSAIFSYLVKNSERTKVDFAHAPTLGKSYKHSPSAYNLVFGESSKRSFEEHDSIVCGKVIEIGAPRLDVFLSAPIVKKRWENDILFLPSYVKHKRHDEEEEIMAVLSSFLLKFPEVKLTIKHHPARNNSHAEKLFLKNENVRNIRDGNLLQEIDKHDVVIMAKNSSSGIEVIAREKPLIRLEVHGVEDWFGYTRLGYALDAKNLEQLCEVFLRIRSNPGVDTQAKKRILDYHLANHGRAGREAGVFFNKIVSESR
jgi:hypothetical protein